MHESEKRKVKSLSHVWLLAIPWTAAHQAPLSMGFSRQEYWSGVPVSISFISSYYFFCSPPSLFIPSFLSFLVFSWLFLNLYPPYGFGITLSRSMKNLLDFWLEQIWNHRFTCKLPGIFTLWANPIHEQIIYFHLYRSSFTLKNIIYLAAPGLSVARGIFDLHCGMQDLFYFFQLQNMGPISLTRDGTLGLLHWES